MGTRFLSMCAPIPLFLGFVVPLFAQTAQPHPYASIATDGEGYQGPGRAAAYDLAGPMIRVGLLAPLQGPRKPEGDAMLAAAKIALHDALPNMSFHGRPVTLAVEDSSGPSWGVVSDAIIRLVLNEEVIALITSSSGVDAHLAVQVGNRIGVPVLTLAADATTTQIDIPWVFRLGVDDETQAQLIARHIDSAHHLPNIIFVTQPGHDGDRGTAAMRHAIADRGYPALQVAMADVDPNALVRQIVSQPPDAIVIWTDTATAARLLVSLHAAGVKTPCYLSGTAPPDLHTSPPADWSAGEVWTLDEDAETSIPRQLFAERFQRATGLRPDGIATRTYDAVTLTLNALRATGPNRALVRDRLSQTHAFNGMSGEISFDREGNRQLAPRLVKLQ